MPPLGRGRLTGVFRRDEVCNLLVLSSDGEATLSTNPFVLFSSYRDIIYLICANMNSQLLLHVEYPLSIMLSVVYGISVKNGNCTAVK